MTQKVKRRKAGRDSPGHKPAKAKTNFNKLKVVRRRKGRIDLATKGV